MYQINKMNQRNQMNQINQISLQPEPLLLGDRYNLQVTAGKSGNISKDYALAWRMDANPAPVPLPPAAWLFITGAIGLLLATRAASGTGESSRSEVRSSRFSEHRTRNFELPVPSVSLTPHA